MPKTWEGFRTAVAGEVQMVIKADLSQHERVLKLVRIVRDRLDAGKQEGFFIGVATSDQTLNDLQDSLTASVEQGDPVTAGMTTLEFLDRSRERRIAYDGEVALREQAAR